MNGEENTTTVFIVASSPIARAGLEAVLTNDERLIITESAAEISAAPSVFSPAQAAEVLLINVEREKDFNDLLRFLSDDSESNETDFPFAVALFSAEFQTAANLSDALQNNLRGALPHDASAGEIVQAVKAVAQNLTVLSPEFTEMFLSADESKVSSSIGDDSIEKLTAREMQVLELLAEGESNKRIANVLNISEHTVKFHVASVFGKLGATTRTEVVTTALRRGLILL